MTNIHVSTIILLLIEFQVSRDEGILLLGYQIIVNVLNVMGLVVSCSLLRNSVRQTADIAHKVMIVSTSNDIRDRVCAHDSDMFKTIAIECFFSQMMQFSLQIQRSMPTFTAFEMFEIDPTLIYAVCVEYINLSCGYKSGLHRLLAQPPHI